EVMDGVREEIEMHVPGLQIELLQLMEDLIGDLTSVPQPIEIKLYSDDEATLHTLAPKLADTISKVKGVIEVKPVIIPAGDDLKRMVAVTARISGRDLGSTVRDVKRALTRSNVIPNNVLYRFGGLYEQQQIAFRGLTLILFAAIVLVFLLLLFLYESFSVAG